MLESVTIKTIATYDPTGIKIENLKKINFIYGANGCGKTTFSKFIYDNSNPIYSNCHLGWKG
jgi:AAA15 family ATPase/GTPase